eukprot:GDKJ01022947.1.p1 GENE.GDKJ01022947.1~~GDKJ01022947.1.p1  ORF type:complete len:601 (-),score=146.30 GDKJ01022947.1:74-1876(-)
MNRIEIGIALGVGTLFTMYHSRKKRFDDVHFSGPNVPSNFMIDVADVKHLIAENQCSGVFQPTSCAPGVKFYFNTFPANGPKQDICVADPEHGICAVIRPLKGKFAADFIQTHFVKETLSKLSSPLSSKPNDLSVKTVSESIRSVFAQLEKSISYEALKACKPLLEEHMKKQLDQVNSGELDLAAAMSTSYKKASSVKHPSANPFYRLNIRPFQKEFPNFKAFFTLPQQPESVTSGASIASIIATPLGLAASILGGFEAYAYTVSDGENKTLTASSKTASAKLEEGRKGIRSPPKHLEGAFIGGKHYFTNKFEIDRILENQKPITLDLINQALEPTGKKSSSSSFSPSTSADAVALWNGAARYTRLLGVFNCKGWQEPVKGPFVSAEADTGVIPLTLKEKDEEKKLKFIVIGSPEFFKLVPPSEAGAIAIDTLNDAQQLSQKDGDSESMSMLSKIKSFRKTAPETDPATALLKTAVARAALRDSKYPPLFGDCQPTGSLQSKINKGVIDRGFHAVDVGAVDELVARMSNARRCTPVMPVEGEVTALQHLLKDDLTVFVMEVPEDLKATKSLAKTDAQLMFAATLNVAGGQEESKGALEAA